MHVLTRIHKSHHRLICIWAHVVRTHKCLCPCECSHLEPLCIHTYVTSIHIFHIIPSQTLLYINPCCALSHLYLPLRVLTVRTSLYTCIYSQAYICSITNPLVYEPMWCKLTDGCALASSHTWNLFVYIHMLTSIHCMTYFTLQILLRMTPCCANSHMSVPVRVLTP